MLLERGEWYVIMCMPYNYYRILLMYMNCLMYIILVILCFIILEWVFNIVESIFGKKKKWISINSSMANSEF